MGNIAQLERYSQLQRRYFVVLILFVERQSVGPSCSADLPPDRLSQSNNKGRDVLPHSKDCGCRAICNRIMAVIDPALALNSFAFLILALATKPSSE